MLLSQGADSPGTRDLFSPSLHRLDSYLSEEIYFLRCSQRSNARSLHCELLVHKGAVPHSPDSEPGSFGTPVTLILPGVRMMARRGPEVRARGLFVDVR